MRRIILYIASSLNGKIADSGGDVSWLENIPNPEKTDYSYSEFLNCIDTTIMGNVTYKQLISWGIEFPYKDKSNFVLTNNQGLANTEYVEFVSRNHIEFIKSLKQSEGKDIWLIGGGQVNTFLLNARLVDEIRIFIMPVILDAGIDLFGSIPDTTSLYLVELKKYTSGAVEIKYTLNSSE